MKEIPLTQGKTAIVDDEDYESLRNFSWQYSKEIAVRRYGPWAQKTFGYKGTIIMHRQILGNPAGGVIKHINGNKLDNRKENLQLRKQKHPAL